IELVDAIVGKSTAETQKELCLALDIDLKEPEKKLVQKDESVHLTVTLSKELHEKLMRCKDFASHMLLQQEGDVSINALFEFLADEYLEKATFVKNEITGSKTEKEVKVISALVPKCSGNSTATDEKKALKTLTPRTRREIFQRDRCCQYVDKRTGKQCGSTFLLQVDHKTPRWAARWTRPDHSPPNLQILCAEHNKLKYSKESGVRILS
ncbi:MAG TPA: HNH endonuclease signature motif containing protein, partial [Bdellovibrio sp.]|nr:HNH endonuclease signature motif containing protein [Bdellovibrio sp.]